MNNGDVFLFLSDLRFLTCHHDSFIFSYTLPISSVELKKNRNNHKNVLHVLDILVTKTLWFYMVFSFFQTCIWEEGRFSG